MFHGASWEETSAEPHSACDKVVYISDGQLVVKYLFSFIINSHTFFKKTHRQRSYISLEISISPYLLSYFQEVYISTTTKKIIMHFTSIISVLAITLASASSVAAKDTWYAVNCAPTKGSTNPLASQMYKFSSAKNTIVGSTSGYKYNDWAHISEFQVTEGGYIAVTSPFNKLGGSFTETSRIQPGSFNFVCKPQTGLFTKSGSDRAPGYTCSVVYACEQV